MAPRTLSRKRQNGGAKKIPLVSNKGDCLFLVTIAAAAAATAVTASSTTTATTAAARPAFFARTCFIDGKLAAIEFLVVQRRDGRLGFIAASHLDEPEAFGSAGVAIDDDLDGLNRPILREHVLQIGVGHAVGQITDIQLHSHGGPPNKEHHATSTRPTVG